MTTSRTGRSGWVAPATTGAVAAVAGAAMTWAALVPPAAASDTSAPVRPARSATYVSAAQVHAVDRASRDLRRVRHHLRNLVKVQLPDNPRTEVAPPSQSAGAGHSVPRPAPVYVAPAPAPPPVQTTSGASGATH